MVKKSDATKAAISNGMKKYWGDDSNFPDDIRHEGTGNGFIETGDVVLNHYLCILNDEMLSSHIAICLFFLCDASGEKRYLSCGAESSGFNHRPL